MAERGDLERALEESERRFQEVFETNTAVKLVIDPDGGAIVDANEAAVRFYGYPREVLCSMRIQQINTMPEERVRDEMERARSEKRLYFRFQHRLANGTVRDVDVYTGPVTMGGRQVLYSIIVDQTERRELERQLLRAQRMEIVGKLAGGVAHDFNNALTVIIGTAELGRRSLPESHPGRARFDEIADVAQRSAAVTRQLLALARKQVVQPRAVFVEDVVAHTEQLLRRLIGEDIEMTTTSADLPCPAYIDPGQLEQVLVNLVVNARDAMPDGGTLTIRTECIELDAADARELEVDPGRWVRLSVVDSGSGMPAEVMELIFEPFFTTKEPHRGTGLGLATCQAIIEHAGGRIHVKSTPGAGSRFEILLPAVDAAVEAVVQEAAVEAPRGEETILVVEDESSLKDLVVAVLRGQGYTVIAAANGQEALNVEAAHEGGVDLLVTDVVMPHMSGTELARRMRERRPALAVLLVSGYSAGLVPESALSETTRFLAKPFTPAELARAVRDLIDASRA